jgi:hypothetical protein
MTDLLKMLHDDRGALAQRLVGIDAAISALNGGRAMAMKKVLMSSAACAKISAAQKRNWAKIKR